MVYEQDQNKECKICGLKDVTISKVLSVCVNCIRENPEQANKLIIDAHKYVRKFHNMEASPPKTAFGIPCNLCSNECIIGEGEKGFCGLRKVINGKISTFSNATNGILHTYSESHVTNCCASWFCPGGTGNGHPSYACMNHEPEYGYTSLAVFMYGCNFDCLFCQNSSHKNIEDGDIITSRDLANEALSNHKYTCVCYFGGSPEPQLPFVLNISRKIIESASARRIMRICFEWNGCGKPELVKEAAEISLKSGGNIKFDLKSFNSTLSLALSGVSNEMAYSNFEMIAQEFYKRRADLPLLTATTLLVPHYVDVAEIKSIVKFISEINDEIPYSLLIFHPDYFMGDLPITPRKQVEECFSIAKKHLKNVHLGNTHLLGLSESNII
ncbi:hypothetical protein AC481_06320 [miscellaneous Crenarchaeota group archaeon SMTZ-80]|nr:MAG: hypothetical protein AC481_06320 [miscellaneous Crenarchaeota group archaeon SMTZ-80]